jgi:uronate dehydrogenase
VSPCQPKILGEAAPGDPRDPAQMFHGGPFAAVDIGQSGLAQMAIVDDRKKV